MSLMADVQQYLQKQVPLCLQIPGEVHALHHPFVQCLLAQQPVLLRHGRSVLDFLLL